MGAQVNGRRERLLDEIEAIALEEGFRDLSVGVLAARLHCSRSTLYKLAPSKQALMRLVFVRFINRAIDDMQRTAERESDPIARISSFVRTIQPWQARGSIAFWRDARDYDLVAGVLDEESARGYRILQGYMDEGIAQGKLRPMDTRYISYLGWLVTRSARDVDVLGRYGLSPFEAMGQVADFIIYGLVSIPPPKEGT